MSLTDTDIAGHVVATVNTFREPLEVDGRETLFVGQSVLVSDVIARIARDESPRKAVSMIMGQLDILFEEHPGLKAEVLAEQMRLFMQQA